MEKSGFVRQLMQRCAEAEETAVAFSLYDGSQVIDIAYHRFLKDVQKSTGYFIRKNIKGQHIAIAAENSYSWLVVFFGITGSGNIAVLLNQDLPEEVLGRQCALADVTMICSNASRISELGEIENTEFLDFEEIRAGEAVPLEEIHGVAPEKPTVMMFTSGTTGESKITVFSGSNLLFTMENMEQNLVGQGTARAMLTFPLYHVSGLDLVVTYLKMHKTVCIGRGMRYILADIPVLNPTYIPMVPSILGSVVKLLKSAKTEAQRQKIIGNSLMRISVVGAAAKDDLFRYMMDQEIVVATVYGMTESTGSGTHCFLDANNIGTIGKPQGHMQCRIENGELLLKGPSVMMGYYKDPEETANIIQDGWLHTGDLAYCDENGYYYLVGRKKNVIILSNGENVNPEEIEAKLSSCPDILEVLVYSDGKKICADIYTTQPQAAGDFVKKYNENVPMYRQVNQVNYTSAPLEKTGTGKIKRKENKYV